MDSEQKIIHNGGARRSSAQMVLSNHTPKREAVNCSSNNAALLPGKSNSASVNGVRGMVLHNKGRDDNKSGTKPADNWDKCGQGKKYETWIKDLETFIICYNSSTPKQFGCIPSHLKPRRLLLIPWENVNHHKYMIQDNPCILPI